MTFRVAVGLCLAGVLVAGLPARLRSNSSREPLDRRKEGCSSSSLRAAAAAGAIAVRTRVEERELEGRFGDAYASYRRARQAIVPRRAR